MEVWQQTADTVILPVGDDNELSLSPKRHQLTNHITRGQGQKQPHRRGENRIM